MRFYVIRHGHRADKEENYTGGGNTPLSERGQRQAEYMAEFMAAEEPDATLYSSCQLRSIQTALPLHQQLDGDWHVWPVFCEHTSLSWDELMEKNPERAAETVAWRTDEPVPTLTAAQAAAKEGNYYLLSSLPDLYPGVVLSQPFSWPDAWWFALQGQSRETAYARLELGVRALMHRHEPDDRIVLVVHGNSGDFIVSILTGLPRTQPRHIGTANTGITRVDLRQDGTYRLAYVNRRDHLPPELQR